MGWLQDAIRQSAMRRATEVVDADSALPGRAEPVVVAPKNIVTGNPMVPPFPEGHESIVLDDVLRRQGHRFRPARQRRVGVDDLGRPSHRGLSDRVL